MSLGNNDAISIEEYIDAMVVVGGKQKVLQKLKEKKEEEKKKREKEKGKLEPEEEDPIPPEISPQQFQAYYEKLDEQLKQSADQELIQFFQQIERKELKQYFEKLKYHLEKNDAFTPFGQAFYELSVNSAEIISREAIDKTFWIWIAEVNDWLKKLSHWQQEVTTTFKKLDPAQSNSLEKLKTDLGQLQQPGSPPSSAPTQLRGKII